MALPKSFDYQFNCLQLPPAPLTPRAARSTRRRCLFKRKSDDQQMYAFDLLATVAGKLLSDGEICPPSTSKEEQQPPFLVDLKREKDEEKTCERNFIITELVSEVPNPKEITCGQNDPVSGITTSDGVDKVGNGSAEQLVNDDCKLRLGIFNPEPSGFRPSKEDDTRKPQHVKTDTANNNTRNLSIGNNNSSYRASSGHQENPYRKSSSLACSVVNNVKFPFPRDHNPCGSFPVNRENVKLVSNRDDDDENSYECTEPSNARNKLPPPPPSRRFRRLVPGSFHSKTTSNVKEDERNNNSESGNYPTRKHSLQGQRSLRDYPFKKRKLFDCGSSSNSDEGGASSENGVSRDGLGSGSGSVPTVTQTPTSVPGGYVSYHSRNPPVKLKIKSFKVPELIIEIPETATVGSLKKTVMEAVNSVLGGGLRVGVLLQGKKIRDDSKTLAQAGISHDNKMDSLGFTLEPSSSPPAPPIRLYHEDRPSQMLCQSPQPLARYPPTSRVNQNQNQNQTSGHQRHLDHSTDLPGSSFNNFMENDHESDLNMSRQTSESKALVPLSSSKQDALAVVPLRKSKRSESAQRRIRRPFTVAEVEALVQAVEKLGTGRWRDVKLRAFDSAKHRTYVDLKDKWKTLVHTARISPQQRRGEPVPQELLDRVLTAHAYWSQQQAKQQLKSQPDTCLLL